MPNGYDMIDANKFLTNVEQDYPDYLRDESRKMGRADSISFPKTEKEIKDHCGSARKMGRTVTTQGARTGITGGAVPEGGHILNLSRMNRMLGLRRDPLSNEFFLAVQPGVLLSDVQQAVAKKEFNWDEAVSPEDKDRRDKAMKEFLDEGAYFFPPDVTENSATIGGMAACNASGAESFFYGPTRKYVERIRVVLFDGSVMDLRRGGQKADGRTFSLETDTGRIISGILPSYQPVVVKNSSGYFVKDNMDLLDLFIGSEGTLGVFSEIELRLIPAPGARWVVMAFFPSEESAIRFVERIRGSEQGPVAIEFFDCRGLNLFREHKKENPAFREMPDIPSEWHTALYLEFHGDSGETVENAVMRMSEIMTECGGDTDAVWLACNEREITRLKDFRHAVPEAVNMQIDERRKKVPGLTKLGTDMAVPDAMLEEVMALYHRGLEEAGLEYVIFGHIGNNHLHVNIIPKSIEEYELGKNLYLEWARKVVKWGGTVSAEHGIGKLKKAFLQEMYGEEGIRQMREVKKLFDPEGVLNPGNLF